jgi:ATP-dependent protease ClpP protease subunit
MVETIERDTDRDNFLSAEDSLNTGWWIGAEKARLRNL